LTLIQLARADGVRGRVLSIVGAANAAGTLVSLSCTGALIDLWGVRIVIGGAAILILVCGVLCCALAHETPSSEDDSAPPIAAQRGLL
jgi:MFS family permease